MLRAVEESKKKTWTWVWVNGLSLSLVKATEIWGNTRLLLMDYYCSAGFSARYYREESWLSITTAVKHTRAIPRTSVPWLLSQGKVTKIRYLNFWYKIYSLKHQRYRRSLLTVRFQPWRLKETVKKKTPFPRQHHCPNLSFFSFFFQKQYRISTASFRNKSNYYPVTWLHLKGTGPNQGSGLIFPGSNFHYNVNFRY
jgi:hypothetical protein